MKTTGKYILDGKTPILCDDLMEWAKWFETADRRVAKDELPDGVEVSTVFLGIDHNFNFNPPDTPILFETIIFGGEHDGYQEKYATWKEAEEGHKKAVTLALI